MSDEVYEAEIVEEPELDRCKHINTRNNTRCTKNAIYGYPYCKSHLSSATIEEIGLVRAKDVSFADIKGRKITNPLEELALLASEILTYKDYCAMQVARLRGDERYEGRGGEQLRAEVALYERSLDRAGKILIDWSRLNIDERLAKIEEAKANAILDVIRHALSAAEVDEEMRAVAEKTAIKELKALSRGNR